MASDLKRISGLWLKESNACGKYMAGKSDEPIPAGSKLLIFKNDRKENDTQPDYQLMAELPEATPATGTPTGPTAAQTRKANEAAPADDSIPF